MEKNVQDSALFLHAGSGGREPVSVLCRFHALDYEACCLGVTWEGRCQSGYSVGFWDPK